METINEKPIAEALMTRTITPNEAVEMKAKLSGLYSFYSAQLEEILIRKPNIWLNIRAKHKSDAACDREWERTDDGINETGLSMRLKRIEKMMSSLTSIVNMANVEYTHTK